MTWGEGASEGRRRYRSWAGRGPSERPLPPREISFFFCGARGLLFNHAGDPGLSVAFCFVGGKSTRGALSCGASTCRGGADGDRGRRGVLRKGISIGVARVDVLGSSSECLWLLFSLLGVEFGGFSIWLVCVFRVCVNGRSIEFVLLALLRRFF